MNKLFLILGALFCHKLSKLGNTFAKQKNDSL